jgi:dTDP-4-amino-4,6-dideoxygalactose transaminase
MLVTDDPTVAEAAAKLRNHGAVDQYRPELIGYNSRLDELQAAVLRLKLRHLDSWNEGRRRVARRYDEALADRDGVVPPYAARYARHVYHQYTIRVKNGRRDEVREKLGSAGVGTGVYYPEPLHRLPGYGSASLHLVEAERASTEVLNLPVGPHVDPGSVDYVLQQLDAALPRGV